MGTLGIGRTAFGVVSRWGQSRRSRLAGPLVSADFVQVKRLIDRAMHSQAYSVLAFPILIVLAALLLFIPTSLLSGRLRAEVEKESIVLAHRIESLQDSPDSTVLMPLEAQEERLRLCRQDAVVKLGLICEYLFVREGYDAIKPPAVKQELSQTHGDTRCDA